MVFYPTEFMGSGVGRCPPDKRSGCCSLSLYELRVSRGQRLNKARFDGRLVRAIGLRFWLSMHASENPVLGLFRKVSLSPFDRSRTRLWVAGADLCRLGR